MAERMRAWRKTPEFTRRPHFSIILFPYFFVQPRTRFQKSFRLVVPFSTSLSSLKFRNFETNAADDSNIVISHVLIKISISLTIEPPL